MTRAQVRSFLHGCWGGTAPVFPLLAAMAINAAVGVVLLVVAAVYDLHVLETTLDWVATVSVMPVLVGVLVQAHRAGKPDRA